MRIRKTSLLFGLSCLVVFGCIVVLLGRNKNLVGDEQNDVEDLEKKVKELERDLQRNYEIVQKIGKSVSDLLKQSSGQGKADYLKTSEIKQVQKMVDGRIGTKDCMFVEQTPLQPDVQMLNLYSKLKFDNPDGGVWKQGWDVQYDDSQFSEDNKLKVFVVPHSHNDPGWIKTFQKYYEDQTRHILNNMVRKVSEEENRKFIWAEISYLDLWWKESEPQARDNLKQLVDKGQIEIVTGGWVMNDEANTHYYAMIEQLTSGHEWLKQKLNFSPRNGWAIDPFGLSSSMAYLLKRSGLENMVIQRVHYAVKKVMAAQKNLEFRWRQNWDRDGQTDMLCHMMPFYSYDVPHTCGPDPKICCQFDFRRLSSSGQTPIHCPWKVPPQPITESNVHRRAALLLDQYRKKSSLYKTNVLLIQLGDDFRYDTAAEFDQQFINYQKLFDYMNSRSDWFVDAQFGTLKDYFDSLRASVAQSVERFPSLSGDFFTYADIDDHYWSGYYTTRPFYKQLDRVLESYLRSAEIIYSMTWSHLHRLSAVPERSRNWMGRMMALLSQARRHLAIFQHHDGITGTEKDHVVQDYAKMMQNGIQNSQMIIQQCAHFLLHPDQASFEPQLDTLHFSVDDEYSKPNELPLKSLVRLQKSKRRIVFYNSLASERIQVVTLRTSHYNVEVTNDQLKPVNVQVSPVFITSHQLSNEEFEISFLVSIPPLGMSTYMIRQYDGTVQENAHLEVSRIAVRESRSIDSVAPFTVDIKEQFEPFTLENTNLKATFDSNGLLTSISQERRETVSIAIQFVHYGTRGGNQAMSGAYLFLPDGPAKLVEPNAEDNRVRIVQGSIRSQVVVTLPFVVHQVTLHRSPGIDGLNLDIDNLVNLSGHSNVEVAMRLVTSLDSGTAFYSDLNGLQMTRREKWEQLPLQAQFYPMPAMAYIEDSTTRITLATKQPLGVASLSPGQLEVMLDRRLNQDDNRGLGQGIYDNVIPTLNSFRLLVEPRIVSCKGSHEGRRADGYPSLSAHRSLHGLLYPVHQLVWNVGDGDEQLGGSSPLMKLHGNFKPASSESGSDIHVVNLRTATRLPDDQAVEPSSSVSLVLHRLGFDCCFPPLGLNSSTANNGEFSLDKLFPDYFGNRVRPMSLTSLGPQGPAIEKSFTIALKPMEIYTFELQP
uniref:Alpha-mannosidase n=1 Tax=Daphnia magna TaxID=35525 RepID=A0A0P5S8D1_9CRUS